MFLCVYVWLKLSSAWNKLCPSIHIITVFPTFTPPARPPKTRLNMTARMTGGNVFHWASTLHGLFIVQLLHRKRQLAVIPQVMPNGTQSQTLYPRNQSHRCRRCCGWSITCAEAERTKRSTSSSWEFLPKPFTEDFSDACCGSALESRPRAIRTRSRETNNAPLIQPLVHQTSDTRRATLGWPVRPLVPEDVCRACLRQRVTRCVSTVDQHQNRRVPIPELKVMLAAIKQRPTTHEASAHYRATNVPRSAGNNSTRPIGWTWCRRRRRCRLVFFFCKILSPISA